MIVVERSRTYPSCNLDDSAVMIGIPVSDDRSSELDVGCLQKSYDFVSGGEVRAVNHHSFTGSAVDRD
ncbi:hypothetical protein E3G69_000050 [Mycobacteroides abscessus]|nr:hypothetical protein [Mycobacteroides abscessus]QOF41040.1 hypothetical protein E3G69_000050 [Mycobacteroides abscessus]SIJ33059.1 Uncharacterised protein [Mycobacteroides abscessus subsp. bolletii]